MEKRYLEMIYLTEEEEIELFEIIEEYKKNGYRVVINKALVDDNTAPYSYVIGFAKEEEWIISGDHKQKAKKKEIQSLKTVD